MQVLLRDFYDVAQHQVTENNKEEVVYVHNYEPQYRNFLLIRNKHLFPFIYELFNEFMCTEFTCEGVVYKVTPNDKQFVFKGTNNSYPNSFQWEVEFAGNVITFESFLQLNRNKTISIELEDREDIVLID